MKKKVKKDSVLSWLWQERCEALVLTYQMNRQMTVVTGKLENLKLGKQRRTVKTMCNAVAYLGDAPSRSTLKLTEMLRCEWDILWNQAVLARCGNITIFWNGWDRCVLGNGLVFKLSRELHELLYK